MSLHKLSAGEGYTYLTRQVAAADRSERTRVELADYYSEHGERPGVWLGAGLAGVDGVDPGSVVSEPQMRALFGAGMHPNAASIKAELKQAGATTAQIRAATRLGRPFPVYPDEASAYLVALREEYRSWNLAHGQRPEAPVPEEVRQAMRTRLGREWFARDHGRLPQGRELAAFIARASRQPRQAVAGYDLTFSPVKSVSALWAIAPRPVAERVQSCHDQAVREVLAWLEAEIAHTRVGAAGVRQVDVTGLIAAAFTHRDSRAGDPDLHTHVAVSNKVQTFDGSWYALDGQPLHQAIVAASERYNTRLESLLRDELTVTFQAVPHPEGRRPVREIVGMDPALLTAWSRRRQAIDVKRAELAAAFTAAQGRPPSTVEALQLAQQATLATRPGKHEPRSLAEQRDAWRAEAIAVLGSPERLAAMLATVLPSDPATPVPDAPRPAEVPVAVDVAAAAARVVARVAGDRAHWQDTHLIAETLRQTGNLDLTTSEVDILVPQITAAALDQCVRLTPPQRGPVDPPLARRADGTSMHVRAHSARYTSTQVLADEQTVLEAADHCDGRRVDAAAVEVALLEVTANGSPLNPGQRHLVGELATSGARVQLSLAPAGAGKTTAMTALAAAWTSRGGTVLSLGPSAVAAAELGAATGTRARTLAELTYHLASPDPPAWVMGIDDTTLIVVDEAGMAATGDLATIVRLALERGASVRLIGDDRQLAAIGAGGLLRDLAAQHDPATLTEVVRFADPAEAAATLALRDGDVDALGFYLDHDRVHDVDQALLTDTVLTAWAGDIDAGRTSLMMASDLATVTALNAAARAHRLAGQPPPVQAVDLRAGTQASAGDVLITRRNDRSLRITGTDFVKNGDRFTLDQVTNDGVVVVRHHGTGHTLTLPRDYVAGHVDLGYACTIHTAQGQTVDTAHLAVTGGEDRQGLYVALTRGRTANHVYLSPAGDGDPHTVVHPDTIRPPTAVEVLHRIVTRDGTATSATTTLATLDDPAQLLTASAGKYADAVALVATNTIGPDRIREVATAADQLVPDLTSCPTWDTLASHLANLDLDGRDPITALQSALDQRELGTAQDVAAVLDHRLDPTGHHSAGPGPLPWLAGIPDRLATGPHGAWLTGLRDLVTGDIDTVTAVAAAWTADTAPAWAWGLLDRPALVSDLAVWRAVTSVPDDQYVTGGNRTGPRHDARAARTWQRRLDQRVTTALTTPPGGPWRDTLIAWQPRTLDDPWFPVLATRLDLAHFAGRDVTALLADARTSGPLPDDHPAAALWYRLAPHLGPISRYATATHLRPLWARDLRHQLGQQAADRIVHDPAWPALVAAVHAASVQTRTPAADLLAAALALTGPIGTPDGVPLDLAATVIAWRISDLTTTPADEPHVLDEHDLDPIPADYTPSPDPMAVGPHLFDSFFASLPDPVPAADYEPPPPDDPQTPTRPADLEAAGTEDSGTGLARILQLTAAAGEHYAAAYPGSPAAAYLAERLGTDLSDQDRWTIGYAAPGWTNLIDHLRATHQATDTELLDAGLGKRARSGQIIDVFRDRLLFGLHNADGQLVGFIGRAAPGAGPEVPKYLNTPATLAFQKRRILFGLAATRDIDGATPVLVEGPLDALAVTIGGGAAYVGVATCGTALTQAHVEALIPQAGHDWLMGHHILVAPDEDPAGQKAARAAHDLPTAAGVTPTWLRYSDPDAKDAADAHRAGSLAEDLTHAHPPLAALLLEWSVAQHADGLAKGWVLPQVRLCEDVARTLATQPTRSHWNTLIHDTARQASPDQTACDALMSDLFQQAFAVQVGWHHQPLSPAGLTRSISAAATLQIELDHAPDAEVTQSSRARAMRALTAEVIGPQDDAPLRLDHHQAPSLRPVQPTVNAPTRPVRAPSRGSSTARPLR